MCSIFFETEGSSSGRRLCIQVRYSVFYVYQYKLLIPMDVKQTIPYCTHKSLPEDEHSASKHVEHIKNENINLETVRFFGLYYIGEFYNWSLGTDSGNTERIEVIEDYEFIIELFA